MSKVIIIILICTLLVKFSFQEKLKDVDNVESILDNLMKKYEMQESVDKSLIDQEIDYQYSKIFQKQLKASQLTKQAVKTKFLETGVEVFQELDNILELKWPDVRDMFIFQKNNVYDQWFGITLTSSNVTVFQIFENKLVTITSHPVLNASKIHVVKHYENISLIAEKPHSVTIFHLFTQDGKYKIQEKKSTGISNIKDLTVWYGKNQQYLGILTSNNIRIYLNQQEMLNFIKVIPYGANFIKSLELDDSTYLITSNERETIILKQQSLRQFDIVQTIEKSFDDAALIKMEKGFTIEYFLALSTPIKETIIYKRNEEGAFEPFQMIQSADKIFAIMKNNNAALILLSADSNVINVYQYDGLEFVKLNVKIRGVKNLKVISINGEEQLLVKWRDNVWNVNRINWIKMNEPVNFMKELKQWCSQAKPKIEKISKSIPKTNDTIRIYKAHLQKLKVQTVNEISLQKLNNLKEQHDKLIYRLSVVNKFLNHTIRANDSQFNNLHAQKVRIKCANKCKAKNLKSKVNCDLRKLRKINSKGSLKFEHLKLDEMDRLPVKSGDKLFYSCPEPALTLKDVEVKGLVNGISFDDLQKNALRISGDQEISGEHTFGNLSVDSLIADNVDIASSQTRQKVRASSVHAEELILTEGGILLPLNGEPVTMSGTLSAAKVKFDKLVELRCGIKGKNIKQFAPMVHFQDDYELSGNYTLRNVRITNLLVTADIKRKRGKSFKEIVENAISLSDDVSVQMEFSQSNTIWKNVTVPNLSNFLTRKNSRTVKVTGKKIATNAITLPDSIYSKLPPPRLQANLCSFAIKTSDLKTSTIRVGQATAGIVESDKVYGAKKLNDTIKDSVFSLDEIDLSMKGFVGNVYIKNLNITTMANSPFDSFEQAKFKWYRPHLIKGSFNTQNLQVNSLTVSKGIKIPPLPEIKNMIIEGNLQVKKINGINFDDFVKNLVRIDDAVVLNNVIFDGIVEADEVVAESTNIDLQSTDNNIYLGNTTISGNLEIEGDLTIPNLLSYSSEDDVNTYVVEGSIKFESEPIVENINTKNLQKLIEDIWMLNRPLNLTQTNLIMKNVTLTQPLNTLKFLHTPNLGSWEFLEGRLFSKTKFQDIQVPVYFRDVKIPNIVTQGNSKLYSYDEYLNDLLHKTLKKNKDQVIQDNWRFEELTIIDDMSLHGTINNLNLSSDVARYDVESNKINGKKIVNELTVRNLEGLDFKNWIKDALMQSDTDKPIVINGKKTFDSLSVRLLNVSGKVMDKNLNECLLKIGDQVITGPKILKGSLQAPSLLVKGLINKANLTDIENNKLRRHELIQRLKSNMIFQKDLQILGDLKVQGTFQNVNFTKMNKLNEIYAPVINKMSYLKPFAASIQTVMNHHAKYWYKFEHAKTDNLLYSGIPEATVNFTLNFDKLGDCLLISLSELECDHHHRFSLKTFSNTTGVLINEIISVENCPIVVQVTSNPQSRITIHVYDFVTNSFNLVASVRAPGIVQASVITHNGIVWIATRLKSHMLLVRYELWGDLQKYHLPDSRVFILDHVPATNELILIREDGMWKLEGLAGPFHAFKINLKSDKIETFVVNNEFYVKLICKNNEMRLLKAKYIGVKGN